MLTFRRIIRGLTATLVIIVFASQASPRFEGPRISGFIEEWQVELPVTPHSYSSTLVGDMVAIWSGSLLTMRDASTGTARWSHRVTDGWIADWVASDPAVVIEVARPDRPDVTYGLAGLSAETGRVIWRRTDLTAAGWWRAPYGDAAPTPVVVAEREPLTLTGVVAGTGTDQWATPLPCEHDDGDVMESASDGRYAVVLYRCGRRSHVLTVNAATGTRLWNAPLPGVARQLGVEHGLIRVYHGDALSSFDIQNGKLITRVSECWNGCSLRRADDRLIISRESPRGSVLEAVALRGLTPLWQRTLPVSGLLGQAASLYGNDWMSDGTYFGVPRPVGGGIPTRLHAVDTMTGAVKELTLPGLGTPFAAKGDQVFTVERISLAGHAPRLRLTAFGSASSDPWREGHPAEETEGRPDACALLRKLFPASEPIRLRNPPGCQALNAEGHALRLRIRWYARDRMSALALFADMRETQGGIMVQNVADAAFSIGPHGDTLVFLADRVIVELRSAYLPLIAELPVLARETARWIPHEKNAPEGGTEGMADRYPSPVPLPGTAATMAFPSSPSTVLAGYRNGADIAVTDRSLGGFRRTKYPFTAFSPDGRWAAGVSDNYIGDRDYTYLVDLSTNKINRIPGFKRPRWVSNPTWSPRNDLLLTVWEAAEADDDEVSVGFVLHSPRSGRTTFVEVDDLHIGSGRFQWNRDGTGVVTELTISPDDTEENRLSAVGHFDLRGRSSSAPATPGALSKLDDWYSPSRTRYAVICRDRTSDICVHDAESGALIAQVDQSAEHVLSWYDDDHFITDHSGDEPSAVGVIDLLSRPVAVIARSFDDRDSGLQYFFARRPGSPAAEEGQEHGVGAVTVRPELGVRPAAQVPDLGEVGAGVEHLGVAAVPQDVADHGDGLGQVG
ncbi:hypothetical protein FHS22_001135 [Planomonospora venezuelensis]|uniref:Pyrrolo-quinoline quinone repeat domain-containing protein n=1 Tax=Planomonospora venezuelensis TaxID=1999 RepID=A0A841D0G4_PLAVE|nr:hypothetical protein [Planomonospora venezuelensis]